MTYNVVFENLREGSEKGFRTWRSFSSKDDFEKYYTEKIYECVSSARIVAEDVSESKAILLCLQGEANIDALKRDGLSYQNFIRAVSSYIPDLQNESMSLNPDVRSEAMEILGTLEKMKRRLY